MQKWLNITINLIVKFIGRTEQRAIFKHYEKSTESKLIAIQSTSESY